MPVGGGNYHLLRGSLSVGGRGCDNIGTILRLAYVAVAFSNSPSADGLFFDQAAAGGLAPGVDIPLEPGAQNPTLVSYLVCK